MSEVAPKRNKLPKYVAPLMALSLVLTACGDVSADPEAPQKPLAVSANRQGWDVSFPQCGAALPKPGAFNIVGINGNLPNQPNLCFKTELAWAGRLATNSPTKGTSVYVTVADPGNKVGSTPITDWPATGSNRYGKCRGGNTPACAYGYGEARAKADSKQLPAGYEPLVWLDVEPEYSWLPDQTANLATLEAYVAVLQHHGDQVGIYSSVAIMSGLVGTIPETSSLHGLVNWRLGATTLQQAEANCQEPGFTGPVVIAQVAATTKGFVDQNIAC